MTAHSFFVRNPRSTDIETREQFDAFIRSGVSSIAGWNLHSIDFTDGFPDAVDPAGAVFLGCSFADGAQQRLRAAGAMIFPEVPGVPFDAYRGQLYSPSELYGTQNDGGGAVRYEDSVDARVYSWTNSVGTSRDVHATLATALHDHAISDALDDALNAGPFDSTRVVGVMGGHEHSRRDVGYADAARLGRRLAENGFTVATGGGPGAMEAANLGAYLADVDDNVLETVIKELAATPSFVPSITAWVHSGRSVLEKFPGGRPSLGIPTWFYGREPTNVFATHIAKYFTNSVREAILLQRCNGGIVFLPGAAGTVQEIFQDACENYYASPGSVRPMVLVGQKHWTETLPAWDVLKELGSGREMEQRLHLVDTVDDALEVLS